MAQYKFQCEDDYSDDETVGRSYVEKTFNTDFLSDIAQQFYFFLKASGYDYVTGVRIAKGAASDAVEFSPY